MDGLYSEFESYRILKTKDIVDALRSGLVALDANVLLSLYRYNGVTSNDILSTLEAIAGNLVVPHQVVREFWRNRQSVIASLGSAARGARVALVKNEKSTIDAIDRWAKSVALPPQDLERLSERIAVFFDGIRDDVEDGAAIVLPETPTEDDELLGRLEQLLEGRVGPQPPEAEWQDAVAEGERRVENRIPPGYMDVEKLDSELPERASGDYLVWSQLIHLGREREKDLVLITSDVKEDWWNRGKSGAVVGARRELIEEYLENTGRRFFLLEPSDLLKYSSELDVHTDPGSVEDVERVRNETPVRVPWTLSAFEAVMAVLNDDGYTQAAVIDEAIERGGRVARERVYEIDGREDSQMLRAFTRPVLRVTSELQEEGVVPFGVVPLLRSVYEAGVKASHFAVPQEVVEFGSAEPAG